MQCFFVGWSGSVQLSCGRIVNISLNITNGCHNDGHNRFLCMCS
jgi:hypothetical protein